MFLRLEFFGFLRLLGLVGLLRLLVIVQKLLHLLLEEIHVGFL